MIFPDQDVVTTAELRWDVFAAGADAECFHDGMIEIYQTATVAGSDAYDFWTILEFFPNCEMTLR